MASEELRIPKTIPVSAGPHSPRLETASRSATAAWDFSVEDLVKVFDPDSPPANDGITLRVSPGEVYGLLGPNGAGKSTLVKQVMGLLKPTSGSISLGGYDLVADPAAARQLCSYLPQAQMPIDSFKAREAIEVAGLIRGSSQADVRQRAAELISVLEIEEWGETYGAKLSGGVRRLVGFAMATVCPGPIVFLDEPTNDVDPMRRRLLWERIRTIASDGAAVFLVTHNVLEAEKSVDRLALINQGRIVAQGTPSSLKAEDRGCMRMLVMMAPGAPDPVEPRFVTSSTRVGHNLAMVIAEQDVGVAIAWAQNLIAAKQAEEYALGATSLEDVYIRLTGEVSSIGHDR